LPAIIPQERIEQRIYMFRGKKVMLSHDLAALYNVAPMRLNEAVKRNIHRFPADFMFALSKQEFDNLKSQSAISSWGGARRATPYAFTEEGVAMLSAVLRSQTAVAVSIQIMRTFVRLRQMLASNADLARQLSDLEKKYDRQFAVVFDAIRQLMAPPEPAARAPIGFVAEERGRKRRKRGS
jgi:ORF6N domain